MNGTHQLSLFSELDGCGLSKSAMYAGGLMPSLKARMKSALAAAVPSLSRDQLVDRMNLIAKRQNLKITVGKGKLTLAVLEKWLASNDEDFPPLMGFVVFMLAVGDFSPLTALAEFSGYKLLSEQDYFFYEYGRGKFEAKESARKMKRLEDNITESRKGGR